MNKSFLIRHYGKVTSILIYPSVLILGRFGVNLFYNEYLINFLSQFDGYDENVRDVTLFVNLLISISLPLVFLRLTANYFNKKPQLFLGLFIPFVIFLQFFLGSTLFDCAEKSYDYEINSDRGVIWIIVFPITVVVVVSVGAFFDYIKNKKTNAKKQNIALE